jgi:hypothetical protein
MTIPRSPQSTITYKIVVYKNLYKNGNGRKIFSAGRSDFGSDPKFDSTVFDIYEPSEKVPYDLNEYDVYYDIVSFQYVLGNKIDNSDNINESEDSIKYYSFEDHLMGNNLNRYWSTTTNLTGSSITKIANAGGIYRVRAGGLAGAYASLDSGTIYEHDATKKFSFKAGVKLGQTTNFLAYLGLFSPTGEVQFKADPIDGFFSCITKATTETKTISTIVIDNKFHHFKIERNRGEIIFSIGGIIVANHASDIPVDLLGVRFRIDQAAGTNNLEMFVDYMRITGKFSY